MLFLSCWRWNDRDGEWRETGESINLTRVDWFHVSQEGAGGQYQIKACYHADPPFTKTIIGGGESRDHVCRLFGALLSSCGVPHFPPLPEVDIEQVRKTGLTETASPN